MNDNNHLGADWRECVAVLHVVVDDLVADLPLSLRARTAVFAALRGRVVAALTLAALVVVLQARATRHVDGCGAVEGGTSEPRRALVIVVHEVPTGIAIAVAELWKQFVVRHIHMCKDFLHGDHFQRSSHAASGTQRCCAGTEQQEREGTLHDV